MKIAYVAAETDEHLRDALRTLAEEYLLVEDAAGDVRVAFTAMAQGKRGYRIRPDDQGLAIEYSDLSTALRAVGTVLAGQGQRGDFDEQTDFDTFGIMLDCSRNAVMKVEHFTGWLRRLALLGYNMAMLYTEDTYELDGEPHFGYQRGAYTAQELRAIDAYARRLGIEMIPCIQTLGHLAQILKLWAYEDVKDTPDILLAGEEKTYNLIEKMIRHWSEVFTARRIHVGMDEAHNLGRGLFLDRFGYRDGFAIFNEHLDRVVKLCEKYDLEPMIWSDMYFRLGSKTGDYYDKDAVIPDEAKAQIPRQVRLVYWDYYHADEEFYTDFIARHRALGFEPIMGSGVWTWHTLWHATNYTEPKAGACVRACRKAGVKEIFFTMWGDDGAMCDYDSAMEGLTYVAELAYSGRVDDNVTARRFAAICGGDYQASRIAGQLSLFDATDTEEDLPVWAWPVLWDDPLLGLFWNSKKSSARDVWGLALARYRELADKLSACANRAGDSRAGDLRHIALLAEILARKVAIRLDLEKAYVRGDTEPLKHIAGQVPGLVELLRQIDASWRAQWLRRNKPFGLEVVQIRVAGLIRRYQEMADRIDELLEGKVGRIAELDDVPDPAPRVLPKYRTVATACHSGP